MLFAVASTYGATTDFGNDALAPSVQLLDGWAAFARFCDLVRSAQTCKVATQAGYEVACEPTPYTVAGSWGVAHELRIARIPPPLRKGDDVWCGTVHKGCVQGRTLPAITDKQTGRELAPMLPARALGFEPIRMRRNEW